jgi:hypothetical protein
MKLGELALRAALWTVPGRLEHLLHLVSPASMAVSLAVAAAVSGAG